jgi:carotenoid cleavage dioxygenase
MYQENFPAFNENLVGRKTQYGYVAKWTNKPLPLFDGLIKYDFHSSKSQTHEFGEERYGSEAVFAPRPGATDEDDGWLVNLVHDETTQTSELLVLNAQDITNEPVARVLIPQRVPYGFHGTWISEEQMRS